MTNITLKKSFSNMFSYGKNNVIDLKIELRNLLHQMVVVSLLLL